MIIPGEYIVSADVALLGALAFVAVIVGRTRESVARLEGRLEERLEARRRDDEHEPR